MFNFDDITNENNAEHSLKCPYIPNHPYKTLIIEGSGSEKTNILLNLTLEKDGNGHIDKFYLYIKDLSEPKYQLWIKKCEDTGIKQLNDPKAFIECSCTMNDV